MSVDLLLQVNCANQSSKDVKIITFSPDEENVHRFGDLISSKMTSENVCSVHLLFSYKIGENLSIRRLYSVSANLT